MQKQREKVVWARDARKADGGRGLQVGRCWGGRCGRKVAVPWWHTHWVELEGIRGEREREEGERRQMELAEHEQKREQRLQRKQPKPQVPERTQWRLKI